MGQVARSPSGGSASDATRGPRQRHRGSQTEKGRARSGRRGRREEGRAEARERRWEAEEEGAGVGEEKGEARFPEGGSQGGRAARGPWPVGRRLRHRPPGHPHGPRATPTATTPRSPWSRTTPRAPRPRHGFENDWRAPGQKPEGAVRQSRTVWRQPSWPTGHGGPSGGSAGGWRRRRSVSP